MDLEETLNKGNPWVVMNREKNNLVLDPGLNRPWSSYNKKQAEYIAKGFPGAFVLKATDARDILIKNATSRN